jgi:ribosomal 50S subunit-recycling heat shock protein
LRIDIFLKNAGVIPSRAKVKHFEIAVNGEKKKPSYEIHRNDIVELVDERGNFLKFRIEDIPPSNLSRRERGKYIKILEKGQAQQSRENFLKWLFENH